MEGIPQSQSTTCNLKPKWQERFAFFDQYGNPSSAAYKAALKAAPFGKRLLIGMNFIAFFFGPIYLFVLGLWKKNLSLLGISAVVLVLIEILQGATGIAIPRALDTGINVAINVMYGVLTNYAYYLKKTTGQQGWNPFEGLRVL
ncbi:DUF2628 domain-containing protein [Pseudomonas sp.]|uniref:DUF2628 domain-containing protein n=1 Tax=Pseudomonas sp. TaxID=306 RepID=UPI001AFFA1D8|nr:DUF2628 domain-containing protein [Pseudomonas sp.]MBO9549923.1 DUF2628 domain-containing protein [Pseudomonas sp.]